MESRDNERLESGERGLVLPGGGQENSDWFVGARWRGAQMVRAVMNAVRRKSDMGGADKGTVPSMVGEGGGGREHPGAGLNMW